jgi:hypothetical protein
MAIQAITIQGINAGAYLARVNKALVKVYRNCFDPKKPLDGERALSFDIFLTPAKRDGGRMGVQGTRPKLKLLKNALPVHYAGVSRARKQASFEVAEQLEIPAPQAKWELFNVPLLHELQYGDNETFVFQVIDKQLEAAIADICDERRSLTKARVVKVTLKFKVIAQGSSRENISVDALVQFVPLPMEFAPGKIKLEAGFPSSLEETAVTEKESEGYVTTATRN